MCMRYTCIRGDASYTFTVAITGVFIEANHILAHIAQGVKPVRKMDGVQCSSPVTFTKGAAIFDGSANPGERPKRYSLPGSSFYKFLQRKTDESFEELGIAWGQYEPELLRILIRGSIQSVQRAAGLANSIQ